MNKFKVTIGASKSNQLLHILLKIRHRFWNGKYQCKYKSIENPLLLKAAFELKLREGWRPKPKKKKLKKFLLQLLKHLIKVLKQR